jgi:penicillin-binding protein 1A
MNIYSKLSIFIWSFFLYTLYTLVLWAGLIRINYFGLFGNMPDIEQMQNPKNELASEIYSTDGVLLGKYFRENRSPVTYNEISPNVVEALVATEDVRFEEHSGIDLKASFAIVYYLVKGDQRGSSTLTQQLAKNLFNTRRSKSKGLLGFIPGVNTVISKIKEWQMAIILETKFTKKEIITLYLNTVDFGSNSFGIKVASKTFFNASQDSLTIPQAATLIGLLKAPTLYSPILNPKNSFKRRNTVLELMRDHKYISALDCESYKKEKIDLNYQVEKHTDGIATYFRSVISADLRKWCEENNFDLYGDGLKIYTTIDSRMQVHAEEAVREHMKSLQKKFFKHWDGSNPWRYKNKTEIPYFVETVAKRTPRYKALKEKFNNDTVKIWKELNKPVRMKIFTYDGDVDTLLSPMDSIRYYKHILQTGFMTMDPHTGNIKTWVGGVDFDHFKYDHVRQSKRQPGSSFKPFVYATAVKKGISPCTLIPDAPITFEYDEDGKHIVWTPKNADWTYSYDSLYLRQAMARSINTIAARLIKMVGVDEVIKTAQSLGISTPLRPVPSLSLGSSDVNVFDMVGAYGAFVNKGIWIEPTYIDRIEDHNGNVIFQSQPKTKDALTEEQAAVMIHFLKGGTEEGGGTSQALFTYDIFKGNEIGGKTGTTSNYSDGWFMGVTTQLVGGVWVGGEDRSIHFRTSETGEGSKVALPIFGLFMERIYKDENLNYEHEYFKRPKRMTININCPRRKSKERVDSLSLIEEQDIIPDQELEESIIGNEE